MSRGAQVTLTRLAVVGATCEVCSRAALVSARHKDQTRYYCANHLFTALRPVLT